MVGVSPRGADEVIAALFAGDVERGRSICMKLRAAMVRSCSMTGLRRCSSQAILLEPSDRSLRLGGCSATRSVYR